MKVHLDFETYSECNLQAHGAWVYSRHPSTRVLCTADTLSLPDDDLLHSPRVKLGYGQEYAYSRVIDILTESDEIHAFNSFFECCIIANTLRLDGFVSFSQWHDTMALACAAAWPQSLGGITSAMPFSDKFKKEKNGKKLIRQLCMPQKAKDGTLVSPEVFWGDEYGDLLEELGAYCVQDVIAEKEVSSRLRPLDKVEREVWIEDQRMNWRGIKCDVHFASTAFKLYQEQKTKELGQLKELTGLANPNSAAQLKPWLAEQGLTLPNMQKDTLKEAVKTLEGEGKLQEVLALRMSSSRTPPTKFNKMIAMSDRDDWRIRGTQTYHAASTGRWASRGINTLNLPRPTHMLDGYDAGVMAVKSKCLESMQLIFGNAIDLLCSVIRPALVASRGHRFIVVDYSSIESRVLNWLAGATATLELVREGDAVGDKSRFYNIAAGDVFDMPPEEVVKGSDEYQGGKAVVLACGYQGGQGALASMSETLGIKIQVPEGWKLPPKLKDKLEFANKNRKKERKKPLNAVEKFQFFIVHKWRDKNPEVVDFWDDCNEAAINAVKNPGRKFKVGAYLVFKAGMYKGSAYLWIRLPSGRLLSYVSPRIKKNKFGKDAVYFLGINSMTRQWTLLSTYGGKLAENVTQAVARDLLAWSKLRVRGTVYDNIVMSVYDEVVCDVPEGKGSQEELCDLMCELPEWAKGLPLMAAGDELKRYWK